MQNCGHGSWYWRELDASANFQRFNLEPNDYQHGDLLDLAVDFYLKVDQDAS